MSFINLKKVKGKNFCNIVGGKGKKEEMYGKLSPPYYHFFFVCTCFWIFFPLLPPTQRSYRTEEPWTTGIVLMYF